MNRYMDLEPKITANKIKFTINWRTVWDIL